jgi:hypothetical protein
LGNDNCPPPLCLSLSLSFKFETPFLTSVK